MGKPRLTSAILSQLWTQWNQVEHNVLRFGQYVCNETSFRAPADFEAAHRIDIFFEEDAQRCFDALAAYLVETHA